jgi:hypothetical protein
MEVWKDESTGTTIFVPSTASFLMADTDHLHLDPVGNIESDPKEELTDYTVFVSQEFRPASDNEAEYLEIPDDVDSAVAELAKNLFEGCNSVSEKVERMESFFQENFSYSLNVQIPPGVDPLSHFLVSKPSAHCEYFASGATILLRLGGVPARYVTGFVVQEKNRFGGYWIGTNEDAHAWAEAYDPDNGWTLVETTPPEGIPSVGERGRFEQLTSYVVYLVTTMPTAIWKRVSGWIAQLGWGIGERKTLIGVGIVVVFITGLLLAVWRLRRRLGRKVKVESEDPIVVALQSARSKVDQILKRQGWERKPSETILQFATRIEVDRQSAKSVQSAAEWYRDYCRIRYGNTRNESTVESLKERAITL